MSLARSITSSARGIKQTAVGELQIRPAALLPKRRCLGIEVWETAPSAVLLFPRGVRRRYAKSNWALSWDADMPEFIFTRTRLLSKAVTVICDHKLQPFGIGAAQFALLIAICQREPITRAEIARLQHLNKSTLTRDLKAVLSEGWIEEVRVGANGRSRPVALTKAGKELMLIAQPAWLTAQVEAEALLGKDGMIAVISITDRIVDHPI